MLAQELPAQTTEVARVRLVGYDLVTQDRQAVALPILALFGGDHRVGVPTATNADDSECQNNTQDNPGQMSRDDSHERSMVARGGEARRWH